MFGSFKALRLLDCKKSSIAVLAPYFHDFAELAAANLLNLIEIALKPLRLFLFCICIREAP